MADIQSKYQKLAAEYSKLKAQIPVLKKAVLDEQAKEEELQDHLKVKDQSIRKYEQEIDSLSFRNQQLSARVEVLQHDLDDNLTKTKKNKKLNQNHSSDLASPIPQFSTQDSVIGEELQSKIEENARLHRQVFTAEQDYKQTLGDLQEKLSKLEYETSRHQDVLQAASQQSRSQIDKLTEDKALLEVKLQRLDKESKEAKQAAVEAENQLTDVEEKLTQQLDQAQVTLETKLPFNDSESALYNSLNVPPHNRQQQLQTRELVTQALTLLRELVQGLSNFYTYSEQRTKCYPVDVDIETISDVNRKYCEYLHENADHLRPIEYTFKVFHDSLEDDILVTIETANGLQEFAAKFKCFVAYSLRLLPYQLLSLEEECSVSSCTSSLETKNMELHAAFKSFTNSLTKVETYISIIASQSYDSHSHDKSSHSKMFDLLAKAITDFHETTREMSKHYNAKVSLEHQLPTATQKLRETDECIMSALVSLVTCTSKISAFFAGNLNFFHKTAEINNRGSRSGHTQRVHPCVNSYRKQAAEYMSLISRPCPESVPYTTALHNQRTLVSSTESRDTLAQQVVTFQKKVTKLEQDKEHWMLESQLIQMKLEKEQRKSLDLEKRVSLLEARLTGSIEDNLEGVGMNIRQDPLGSDDKPITNGIATVENSMLGSVKTLKTEENDSDNREKLIRQHFTNRISELISQLQMTDSKAMYFHAECLALHKQLRLIKNEENLMREDTSSAKQNVAQLRDELQTTTKSYEGQLSMMSEHLAAMNEKLTVQKDEIDLLKYQLQNSNKANKKGRLK